MIHTCSMTSLAIQKESTRVPTEVLAYGIGPMTSEDASQLRLACLLDSFTQSPKSGQTGSMQVPTTEPQ